MRTIVKNNIYRPIDSMGGYLTPTQHDPIYSLLKLCVCKVRQDNS